MDQDNQLIQQVKNGNSQAFRTFVMRYQDYIYSVCQSVLKDSFEAREASQDTFLKVHRAIHTFNAESKISSWMYRIAYRTSLDYLRKRKPLDDLDGALNQAGGEGTRADTYIEKDELHGLLMQAIKKLEKDEAAIVRMFYLEELTVRELADITGLSESNVKVKLFRARKRLFYIMNEQHNEVRSYL